MQTHTLRVAAVVLLAACATAVSAQPIPRYASQSHQTVQAEIRAKEHPIYAARAGRSPAFRDATATDYKVPHWSRSTANGRDADPAFSAPCSTRMYGNESGPSCNLQLK